MTRHIDWLSGGLLVAAMTFGAIVVVHVFAVQRGTQSDALDLDLVAAYQICMLGLCVGIPIGWSSLTLRKGRGRLTIFCFWLAFTWLAMVLSSVAISTSFNPSPPCQDTDMFQLDINACIRYCQQNAMLLRAPGDTQYMEVRAVSQLYFIQYLGAASDFLKVSANFVIASNLCVMLGIYSFSVRSWPLRMLKLPLTPDQHRITSGLVTVFTFIVSTIQIVVGEQILQTLPEQDPIYVVGQWGSWVGLVFTVAAAGFLYIRRLPEGDSAQGAEQNAVGSPQRDDDLEAARGSGDAIEMVHGAARGHQDTNTSSTSLPLSPSLRPSPEVADHAASSRSTLQDSRSEAVPPLASLPEVAPLSSVEPRPAICGQYSLQRSTSLPGTGLRTPLKRSSTLP
ncbi:hypothetical protein CALVIDRAFT_536056 [Calocera viscosa TUFC12733]|uniref:Uncharacterized protein n=1 Tax=Calocera viscosa (strain TUFC12733) TaxID=1330018 RepID=A0A167N998_CALVF|nr:hypothetical protein CALVIDRAFT_536056 [Calocera viscosa TUFC12733]